MALDRLNPEQYAAATAPFGNSLVIAGPGTGKTSTIVGRIGFLLDKGIEPSEILLLTFTNKAAREMIERVAARYGKSRAKEIAAGTFHALSYRWLKSIDEKVVLKQPKDLKTLFRSVYDKRAFHIFEEKPYSSSFLYDIYSLYQNEMPNCTFGEWVSKRKEDQRVFEEIYDDIVEEFENAKKNYAFLGFNDLLIRAAENSEKIGPFKEILVDEYQDTNNLQSNLLDSLTRESLFCVGDYDQSIYAFNGANINIIAGFAKRYPKAKIFNLTKNYRSSKYIVSLADRVISFNERIFPKRVEVMRNGEFEKPKLFIFNDTLEQYKSLAAKISASVTPKDEIAVIFRNNSSADGVEAALREVGIGCKRRGGVSFFDSKEIKAAADLLSLIVNPKDLMSFIHVFEYAKGVGPAIGKEIYDVCVKMGEGDFVRGITRPKDMENPFEKRGKNYQLALFDDFIHIGSKSRFKGLGFDEKFMEAAFLKHPKLTKEGAKFLYEFYILFKALKRTSTPYRAVELITKSGLFATIVEQIAKKRAQLKDGSVEEKLFQNAKEKISAKLTLLKEISKSYKEIESFYNAMVLGGSEVSEGSGVNLLTVHASKGLEFKDVYVIDLAEGRFPNSTLVSKGGSIEEERRLFYVAVTRAKDRLFLSFSKYDSARKNSYEPSRFLKEAGLL